MKIFNWILWK